ncbi:hypothetical protein [Desulfovibrio sp. ZJ200]|uniref:hypothetical protein n=1 Tax=Desulfovibrio sp. ZJ200 TaxID=2709792 RepID=UPI0013E9BE64|nr:hypothetical protein [Desulfovibrio sp. ZJ200]
MSFDFPAYVSVQEKRKKAEKMLARLHAKGMQPQPVGAFTGALAKTFWGKSWCFNLERYADFANRLPRGRGYVRHGCICHLEIAVGEVRAKVLGNSLYNVTVHIAPLPATRWQALRAGCAGRIATLIELLRGKLSGEVMAIMCDPEAGMFPSPKEILFSCSCPDSARMCKHVAAALYGVGRRLDTVPEQLFTLRGVDASGLLPSTLHVAPTHMADTLQVEDMGTLFGIDLEMDAPRPAPDPGQVASVMAAHNSGTAHPATMPRGLVKAERPTGTAIRTLHRLSKLDESAFAEALGVTPATLRRWEATRGALRLKVDSILALMRFQEQLLRTRAFFD